MWVVCSSLTVPPLDGGISIPSSYTAHLAPLSSSKLYNEARTGNSEKNLETPYVVMFQAVNILSGTKSSADGRCGPQVQECWEFEHPRAEAILDARGMHLLSVIPGWACVAHADFRGF